LKPLHKIFVFGTLKQGFPNFHLNQGQQLSGQFQTVETYPLYLVGERHGPWLIHTHGQGFNVQGEIYLLNDEQLKFTDEIEREGQVSGYHRRTLKAQNIGGETITREFHQAFCYFKLAKQLESEEIMVGPLDCYQLEHADLYKPFTG